MRSVQDFFKSSIARGLERKLFDADMHTMLLDGPAETLRGVKWVAGAVAGNTQ